MDIKAFAAAANYPTVWLTRGLLDGPFFQAQAEEFFREYRDRKPAGGTEHWRYGSFIHWLRTDIDERKTLDLFEAAIADPDPPMAGNVIKELLGRPFATEGMLSRALKAVAENRYYHVTAQALERIFSSAGFGTRDRRP